MDAETKGLAIGNSPQVMDSCYSFAVLPLKTTSTIFPFDITACSSSQRTRCAPCPSEARPVFPGHTFLARLLRKGRISHRDLSLRLIRPCQGEALRTGRTQAVSNRPRPNSKVRQMHALVLLLAAHGRISKKYPENICIV